MKKLRHVQTQTHTHTCVENINTPSWLVNRCREFKSIQSVQRIILVVPVGFTVYRDAKEANI